jgi:hypothetical protein
MQVFVREELPEWGLREQGFGSGKNSWIGKHGKGPTEVGPFPIPSAIFETGAKNDLPLNQILHLQPSGALP